MKTIFLTTAIAIAALTSGCALNVKLYPVEGPMSKTTPTTSLTAKASRFGQSGSMSLTMPDGEVLTGSWSIVAPMAFSSTSYQGNAQASSNFAWNSGGTTGRGTANTYANYSGYVASFANVPGVNHGQAVLTGEKTIMQIDFAVGSGTPHGNGIARDNFGNIYRVIF